MKFPWSPVSLRQASTLSLLAAGLLFAGCSQNVADFFVRSFVPMNYDKTAMQARALERVVLPGYQRFEIGSVVLTEQLKALVANPSPKSLEGARNAWRLTAEAWDGTEAFQFGPAEEQRLRQQIHFWPRRVEHIEGVLAGSEPLNATNYGTTRRGLPVLEYLLFGPPSKYITTAQGERARRYAAVLGEDLVIQARTLKTYWADAGKRESLSQDPAQLNRSLNQWVMLLEDSRNKRLGAALGIDGSGTQTEPGATEAPDSRASLALLRASLDGFSKHFDNGDKGVDDYLIALGRRHVATTIQTRLDRLGTSLKALESRGGLEQSLTADPAAVRAAYDDYTELLRLVKVDLANALNETVHFTSNDGD